MSCSNHKYIHYADYPPQLFDLVLDPDEVYDLPIHHDHLHVVDACEALLRTMLEPKAVNAAAKRDQAAKIDAHGGPEAVALASPFGPAPGSVASLAV